MKHLSTYPWIERHLSGPQYGFIGLAFFGVKFCLDRYLADALFGRTWHLLDYWKEGNAFYLINLRHEGLFFIFMLALAMPFIAIGVLYTLRRLHTLRMSPAWVLLFFVPISNLFFFGFLILAKPLEAPPAPPKIMPPAGSWIGRFIPESRLGSAMMAIAVTTASILFLAAININFFRTYGVGLFVLLPFLMGFIAAWLHNYHEPRSLSDCQFISFITSSILAGALMLFAMEGMICILMAAPLWLGLGALGAWLGYEVQRPRSRGKFSFIWLLSLLTGTPFLMGAEYALKPEAPLLNVTSAMTIDAAPRCVWKHVVSFSELPPPTEWVFRSGVAYPIRARIQGRGPGAIRRCEFSTGAFIEPIKIWDEPRHLQFSVTENPAPMRELSLYDIIEPPHLHGYLVSKQGEFRLTETAPGQTRLEGTTWYQHHLWPAGYWQLWSDFIIHRIHMRVLRHIKTLSEEEFS